MIKKIWTWKRISSVIILPMVIFILVSSLRLAVLAGEMQVALMFVATLIFFIYFCGLCLSKKICLHENRKKIFIVQRTEEFHRKREV